MRRTAVLIASLVAASLSPAVVHGQVQQGAVRTPAGDLEQLAPDKQERIRSYVRSQEIAPMASGDRVTVGGILPRSTPLRGLPRDMVTEIPKITSYRYVVLPEGIAIVEPATRTVVQIIDR